MNQEQGGLFGPRLRRLREAAGLTQEELASRAGLTAKAVSALERGERKRPYPHTVRSLAEALQLSEQERTVLTEAVPSRDGDSPEATVTPPPFPRIPYDEAMVKYGSDKPDLRNPLVLSEVTEVFRGSGFAVFAGAIERGAVVRGLRVPGAAAQPRSYGAAAMYYVPV